MMWRRATSLPPSSIDSRSRSKRLRAAELIGPTVTDRRLPSRKHLSRSIGNATPGEPRMVTSTPTGWSSNRLSAVCRTVAEEESIHWASSMARTQGPFAARTRSESNTASPIASGSGAAPSESARSSATSSARRLGVVSSGATSSNSGVMSSDSAANDSDASASMPRHISTRNPCSRATPTPASHKIVFPMPAGPEIDNALGPRGTASMNVWIESSSASCPTVAVRAIVLGCIVPGTRTGRRGNAAVTFTHGRGRTTH